MFQSLRSVFVSRQGISAHLATASRAPLRQSHRLRLAWPPPPIAASTAPSLPKASDSTPDCENGGKDGENGGN
eukprot:6189208-Pleurochrysis_carterae.AAC.1